MFRREGNKSLTNQGKQRLNEKNGKNDNLLYMLKWVTKIKWEDKKNEWSGKIFEN